MTPQTPHRCGQRLSLPNSEIYTCDLAAGHRSEFHLDMQALATWSRAGDLELHSTNNQADARCRSVRPPVEVIASGRVNMADRFAQSPVSPTDGFVEDGALNLGPIVERHRSVDQRDEPDAAILRCSQADVMPLVREVMRLRREAANRVANEPSATARSAVAGLARHIEDMRHVFAELVAATCTGCPIVANSSNPEDGADVDPRQDCPVHGEVAELRRQVSFSARAYGQIAEALGPEFTAPFGPDATLAALQCIETARGIDDVLREAGIEYPLGLRGVEDLANQRDGALEHVTELADKMAEALNYDADQNRPVADNLLDDLIKGYHERGGDVCQH